MDARQCEAYVRELIARPEGSAVLAALQPPHRAAAASPPTSAATAAAALPPDLVARAIADASPASRSFLVINQRGDGGSVVVRQPLHGPGAEGALRRAHAALCPEKRPACLHAPPPSSSSSSLSSSTPSPSIFVLERLEPHLLVSHDAWAGHAYPIFPQDAGSFLARSIHGTSLAIAVAGGGPGRPGGRGFGFGFAGGAVGAEVAAAVSLFETDASAGGLGNNADVAARVAESLLVAPFAAAPAPAPSAAAAGGGSADPAPPRFPNRSPLPAPVAAWARAVREDAGVQSTLSRLRSRLAAGAAASAGGGGVGEAARECLAHGDLHLGNLMCAVTGPASASAATLEDLRTDYQDMPKAGVSMKQHREDKARAAAAAAAAAGSGGGGGGAAVVVGEDEGTLSPPPASGDLRVLGGQTAFLGPAGLDVGTLLGSALLSMLAARVRVRQEEATVARGGYAKFSAIKARDRWAEHAGALAEWVPGTWTEFAVRFASLAWKDSDELASAAAAKEDEGGGCCDDRATGNEGGHSHHGGGHGHGHGHGHGGHSHAAAVAVGGDDACCGGQGAGGPTNDGAAADRPFAGPGGKEEEVGARRPIEALASILRDAIGFAGAYLARAALSAGGLAGKPLLEVDGVSSPAARAALQCILLALSRYLLSPGGGGAVAECVARHAAAAHTRRTALGRIACGFDPILAAAAAIDGEPGWADVEKAAAAASSAAPARKGPAAAAPAELAAAPAGALPGRPYGATLVLVAKSPLQVAPVRSSVAATLPAALDAESVSGGVGGSAGRAGIARAFHAACLADIMARFAATPPPSSPVPSSSVPSSSLIRRVLVFPCGASSAPAAAASLQAWLVSASAPGATVQGTPLCAGLGPQLGRAWTLRPASLGGAADAAPGRAALAGLLHGAFSSALRECWGPVLFIGADTPALSWAHVEEGLRVAEAGKACVVPLEDGGFGLLALPPHAIVPLDADAADNDDDDNGKGEDAAAAQPTTLEEAQAAAAAAAARSGPFGGVSWSCETTCASQQRVLQSRLGVEVSKCVLSREVHRQSESGQTLRDVDDARGLAWLQAQDRAAPGGAVGVDGASFAAACPRAEAVLAALPALLPMLA